jgi:hypothetical protein
MTDNRLKHKNSDSAAARDICTGPLKREQRFF